VAWLEFARVTSTPCFGFRRDDVCAEIHNANATFLFFNTNEMFLVFAIGTQTEAVVDR
jgi:hypothetical protein